MKQYDYNCCAKPLSSFLCGERYVSADIFVEELHAQVVIYLLGMAYFFDLAVTFKQKWSGLSWLLTPVGDIFLVFSQHQRKQRLLQTRVGSETSLGV